jgi:hypothetical protein
MQSGFSLSFRPGAKAVTHEWCGEHKIPGAMCPHCKKPLLRLLSLNAADTQLDLGKAAVAPLLYCWTCTIPYGVFRYRVTKSGSVKLVDVPGPVENVFPFGPAGPYEGYTGRFPLRRVALKPLSRKEQELQRAALTDEDVLLDLTARHQVGGHPPIHNPEEVECSGCGEEMPLLAAICDDAAGNRLEVPAEQSFTDNCSLQMVFHYCRRCSEMAAYHSND